MGMESRDMDSRACELNVKVSNQIGTEGIKSSIKRVLNKKSNFFKEVNQEISWIIYYYNSTDISHKGLVRLQIFIEHSIIWIQKMELARANWYTVRSRTDTVEF